MREYPPHAKPLARLSQLAQQALSGYRRQEAAVGFTTGVHSAPDVQDFLKRPQARYLTLLIAAHIDNADNFQAVLNLLAKLEHSDTY